jgi:Protein of unknown function (DUF3995)
LTSTQPALAGPRGRWAVGAGYAAFAWGLIFALISFYWGCGGTIGLSTVGGTIERLAREHSAGIFVAVWVTGLLKLVGAVLALALVRPWGSKLPRRLVALLSWTAAVLLTLYGGTLVAADALAATGAIKPRTPIARVPLLWHLWVWDMSFLIWGLLFASAAWYFTRRDRGNGILSVSL